MNWKEFRILGILWNIFIQIMHEKFFRFPPPFSMKCKNSKCLGRSMKVNCCMSLKIFLSARTYKKMFRLIHFSWITSSYISPSLTSPTCSNFPKFLDLPVSRKMNSGKMKIFCRKLIPGKLHLMSTNLEMKIKS